MRTKQNNSIHSIVAVLSLTLVGASSANSGELEEPVAGLTAEELAYFLEGQALFEHEFTAAEGLGPLFNKTSCVACHLHPGTGGSEPGTVDNVTHFGVDHEGRFLDAFEHGGPVVQVSSLASEGLPGGDECRLQPDVLPTQQQMPGVTTSPRHTPAVFGFGLIDAVPDEEILKYEGKKSWKKPGVLGIANWGVELESIRAYPGITVIRPRTVPSGAPRVGRFGWKAPTATLFQFSAEPFGVELGVSSPFFARENHPQGAGQLPPECLVADNQPNDVNSQMSTRLYLYQAFTAPPPRGPIDEEVWQGEAIFKQIGCADCHRKELPTVKDYYATWPDGSAHRVEALSNKKFEPWTDLLTHDMGEENDDRRAQGRVTGRFWRTTPLWGLRFKTNMWHDGSVTTADDAIALHGGEGTWSRDAYAALSDEQKALVDKFLNSL